MTKWVPRTSGTQGDAEAARVHGACGVGGGLVEAARALARCGLREHAEPLGETRGGPWRLCAGGKEMVVATGLHGHESTEPRWGMGRRRWRTRHDAINSSKSVLEREIKAKTMWPDLRKKAAAPRISAKWRRERKWDLRQNEEEFKADTMLSL